MRDPDHKTSTRISGHAQKPRARPRRHPALPATPPSRRQPLPLPAPTALTSTVGIGATSCSGLRLPNSSASTSIPLAVKEEADRMFTSAPLLPTNSTRRMVCAVLKCPRGACLLEALQKGSAWSRPNLRCYPEVTGPDVGSYAPWCNSEVSPG